MSDTTGTDGAPKRVTPRRAADLARGAAEPAPVQERAPPPESEAEAEASPEQASALEALMQSREPGPALSPDMPPRANQPTEDVAYNDRGADGSHIPANFVRQPFGYQVAKLTAPKRAGYHRHWFNDEPGRVDAAIRAGYTFVKDSSGRNIQRVVGTKDGGGGLTAYYMETPLEWYKADMKAAQKPGDEIERAIRGGTVADKAGDNRYVPKDGIKVEA